MDKHTITHYNGNNKTIIKANLYLLEYYQGYDSDYINVIENIEEIYDIDFDKIGISKQLLNPMLFDKSIKYFTSNTDISLSFI